MKIEIRYTLVDNENWLPANLYVLTSINKGLNLFCLSSKWEIIHA